MGIPKDMAGRKYGRAFVVSQAASDRTRNAMWNCLCDCGNNFTTMGKSLRNGFTKSCGCLNTETRILMCKSRATHGRSKKCSEYSAWLGMKARCYNPKNIKFKHYGGRGIEVCSSWMESFSNFIKDVGNKPSKFHSLDRKKVDGNYEPGNVRWATPKEQSNNRRISTENYMALIEKISELESEIKKLRGA